MKKQNVTKKALLTSVLSLLICVSMLIGTTYAWFTDSVTVAVNKIQAGTLDLQLLMHNGTEYVDISQSDAPIFGIGSIAQNNNAETLWEPGKTQVAYLAIKNNGTLALKYKVALEVVNKANDLYKVMQYAIIPDAEYQEVGSWAGNGENVAEGKQIVAENVSMAPNATHYFALSIHMSETAGNQYQDGQVDFDLNILATQLEAEFDSFNNTYDKDASYPLGKNAQASEEYTMEEDGIDFKATVNIPKEAPEGEYTLKLSSPQEIEISHDKGIASMKVDIKLMRNAEGVIEEVSNSGIAYPVTIQLPHPFVEMQEIYHNGEKLESFTYDKEAHTVSFTTTHFSPFELKYKDFVDPSAELKYTAIDMKNDKYIIEKGIFVDKNPALFDETLDDENSKYIAVDFVKDGIKHYVVSERASTILVGDADDGGSSYPFENTNCPEVVWIANNALQSAGVAKLNKFEHGTLLILPGTYKETARLEPTTNMDIIGLGNREEVKLIKQKVANKSSSHLHLINCNGAVTREEHICVSIRNLNLDATAKNGTPAMMENAAVQAIRLTKVKCYDLVVKGGTVFYINGKYDARGTYMYVQDTEVVNSLDIEPQGVSAPYNFYYHNLTAKGAPFVEKEQVDAAPIVNKKMDPSDWIWD